jgi:hypothetical protein
MARLTDQNIEHEMVIIASDVRHMNETILLAVFSGKKGSGGPRRVL